MNVVAGVQCPTVACLGDSLTGWTDTIGPGYFKGWVQRLQTDMPNRVITNFGVGGYTTSSIKARWLAAAKNCGYSRITVFGGINDLVGNGTDATIEANLDSIFDGAIALGVKVFALKILPFGNHTSWSIGKQIYLENVNSHIDTKAAANPTLMTAIDTYTMFGDASDDKLLNSAYDNGDGLHLNGDGHTLLANFMKGLGL